MVNTNVFRLQRNLRSVDEGLGGVLCRYLTVAAALIGDAESPSKHRLIRLIAWLPAHNLTPSIMRLSIFVWFWTVAAAPSLQVFHCPSAVPFHPLCLLSPPPCPLCLLSTPPFPRIPGAQYLCALSTLCFNRRDKRPSGRYSWPRCPLRHYITPLPIWSELFSSKCLPRDLGARPRGKGGKARDLVDGRPANRV